MQRVEYMRDELGVKLKQNSLRDHFRGESNWPGILLDWEAVFGKIIFFAQNLRAGLRILKSSSVSLT